MTCKQYFEQLLQVRSNSKAKEYFQWLIDNLQVIGPENHAKKLDFEDWPIQDIRMRECHNNSFRVHQYDPEFKLYSGFFRLKPIPYFASDHSFNVHGNDLFDFTDAMLTIRDNGCEIIEWYGIEIPTEITEKYFYEDCDGVTSLLAYYFWSLQ